MDYAIYTERQERIISGEIPITKVSSPELKRLVAKAAFKYDGIVIEFAKKELERRNVRIQLDQKYTEREHSIIDEEVPIDQVSTEEIRKLLRKAQNRGDAVVGIMMELQLELRNAGTITIRDYTFKQSCLIRKYEPIEKANIQAVCELARAALKLCDADVAEWAQSEIERRGNPKRYTDKYSTRERQVIDGERNISRVPEWELCQIATKARISGNVDALQIVEPEIEKRILKTREIPYTSKELLIIQGKSTADDISLFDLGSLLLKLKMDDDRDPDLYETLINDYHERKIIWDKNHSNDDYTDAQIDIILGNTPLYKVRLEDIRSLMLKAERHGDDELVDNLGMEIAERLRSFDISSPYSERQQTLLRSLDFGIANIAGQADKTSNSDATSRALEEHKKQRRSTDPTLRSLIGNAKDDELLEAEEEHYLKRPYTKRECDIMSEEISWDEIRHQELNKLVGKARFLGDMTFVEKAELYLERVAGYRSSVKHRVKDATAYTVTQQRIVRGDIPFEQVTVRELNKILKVAKQNKDLNLITLIETLIDEKQKDKAIIKRRNAYRRYYNKLGLDPPSGASSSFRAFTRTEAGAMAVLEGKIDPKYCSLPDLHYIRMYASTNLDDPVYEEIARFLIEERKDRSIVYIPKTKEEAFALLQIHTIEPLPKADDWFSPS